jgi:hypothetical protein
MRGRAGAVAGQRLRDPHQSFREGRGAVVARGGIEGGKGRESVFEIGDQALRRVVLLFAKAGSAMAPVG